MNEAPTGFPCALVASPCMAPAHRDDASQRRTSPSRRQPPGAGAWGAVVRPLTRTGSYYAESWRDYLDREPRELPIARPSIALAAHAFRDEIVLLGLRARRPVSDVHAFERINAEVVAALDFYGRKGWLDNPARFFAKPPPLTDVTIRPVKARRRSYERISFDSGYTPRAGEPGNQRWKSYTANNREYALMLRHKEPRPWLVCVHGAEMGRAALDLTLFRAWHLHEDLGLNVVLPVLPMHGPRARGLPKGAVFPGEDVMDNVHATAQAVWDVRRLLSWIRSQEPESPIGLNSISLGGYVASLVASLEDGLTCAILGVPVADLIELLGRHAGFSPEDPRRTHGDTRRTDRAHGVAPIADSPCAHVRPLHLRRYRRPARPPTRADRPPVGALGQTRDRLVPRRSHRVLPIATGTALRRRCAGAVRARRWVTDSAHVRSTCLGESG